MASPLNGTISAPKLMLRHWRAIRSRKIRLVCFPGCEIRVSLHLPSTDSTIVQKRWASTGQMLVSQDKHRIPKSDIPPTTAAGLRGRSGPIVRTLNQTRLAAEDYVDIAGRISKSVHLPAAPEEAVLEMKYFSLGQTRIPFPPDSQGFLYWHLEPDAPPISGQVRLRTRTSSDPATFSSGRDLQLPDGRAWHIPLFEIARCSHYSGLRAHLLSERLVTTKVLDTALNISAPQGAKIMHPTTGSHLIWKFGQIFLVDFQMSAVSIWIIGSSVGDRLFLQSLFSVRTSGSTGTVKRVLYRPFTGRALVHFERSTLPEHKGTRTVFLRIVKIIELTKSDDSDDDRGPPAPKEGGLVMNRRRGDRHWTPWSVDVDEPHSSSKALRILFDNEAGHAGGSSGTG
ncbi:hypothetical protein OE88DRAFT_1657236 [Heliocybe sulcata]|uniref:Uncharacterized protein n=1 Tax=Heliocybe sulcata TaxID=5364 RepID=A0A5C3N4G5_9AGAM|nr:hypothetical protein OE88DRAFT_1657236 [Heliocybe sulcata]